MANVFVQVKRAYEDTETFPERASLVWRAFFGILFCIPLLYIAGFLCGCVMFKNPFEAGSEVVNGMF